MIYRYGRSRGAHGRTCSVAVGSRVDCMLLAMEGTRVLTKTRGWLCVIGIPTPTNFSLILVGHPVCYYVCLALTLVVP
eukprot:SAG31_NODE_1287_length_8999_cov_3.844382_7_plen_78_part_00